MNYVQWVGRNSLYFLAIHCPLKGFIVVIMAKVLGLNKSRMVQEDMVYSLVAFFVTMVITSVIVVLINKWLCYYRQKFVKVG